MTTLEYDDHHVATPARLPRGLIVLTLALAAWALVLVPFWLLR